MVRVDFRDPPPAVPRYRLDSLANSSTTNKVTFLVNYFRKVSVYYSTIR